MRPNILSTTLAARGETYRAGDPNDYESLKKRLRGIRKVHFIVVALIASLCVWLLIEQIVTLSYPIIGEHEWRQSDVYAVAYNFAYENSDFFHPRIDWTEEYNGIMGMEPPIVSYLIAGAMTVFGHDPTVGRTVAWSLCMLGLGWLLILIARTHDSLFSLWLLLSILLSPLGIFELRQIQPDGAMAIWSAVAAMLFVTSARSKRLQDYVIALGVYTFAVLLKGPAIVLVPAMLLFSIAAEPVPLKPVLRRAVPLVLPCFFLSAWWWWSSILNETYSPGRSYFALSLSVEQVFRDIVNLKQLRHIFVTLFGTYVNNWMLLPVLVLGMIVSWTGAHRRLAVSWCTWLLLTVFFAAAFSSRLQKHWYYASLSLLPCAYYTAYGLWWLMGSLERDASRQRGIKLILFICVLFILPWAGANARHTLVERSDASRAADYRQRVLQPLRAAVARYTTREDKIVTNGKNPRNLHDAFRKGFTHSLRHLRKRKLAYFAKRGAIIYVHQAPDKLLLPELKRSDNHYKLLAKGENFRIYCLLEHCPKRN